MTDRLSSLLQRFTLRARVYHGGAIRNELRHDGHGSEGRLHLVHEGLVVFSGPGRRRMKVVAPSMIYLPRGVAHRLQPAPGATAEVVCAAVSFGSAQENPLLRSLPDLVCVPLAEMAGLEVTQTLLASESLANRCGHAAVVDRLAEVLVVQLLRWCIERGELHSGSLAGLADARLSRAITAMHDQPSAPWTLDSLAATAGMSRSRFAAQFKTVVGVPAAEYLKRWRVGVAKGLLRRGLPIKAVAHDAGYGSTSAFGKAFAQVECVSPSGWRDRLA
ncbi:cupin domain-containing protein [Hydrogenophaga sp.]|uniref:cupin domain-containing protein n=1 Tax=Hydrogenophaga sp. TaxID=1904254 RepID=UPI003D10334E